MRELSILGRPGRPGPRAPAWFRIWLVSATAWGLFLSGATLATALAQEGSSPPRKARQLQFRIPPPPPQPAIDSPPAAHGDSADSSSSRQILSQLLYRSRPQQVALDRATQALRSGNSLDGLIFLQQALDAPHDSFHWHNVRGLTSTRREARRLLSAQSGEILSLYERLNGQEAERLLTAATQQGDAEHIGSVARRYFHTAAGFQALDWQATWWLDCGEFELAAHAWSRLLAEPVHKGRITPVLLRKHHLACEQADPNRDVDSLDDADFYGVDRIKEIRTAALDGFLPDDPAPIRRASSATSRNVGRSPYLKPVWGIDFASESQDTLGSPLAQWEDEQLRGQRPLAVANFPQVVGDLIIVRDYDGIRAVHQDTGALAWKYIGASSLERAARELQSAGENVSSDGSSRQNVLNYLFHLHSGNATLGTLSSDGQRVYAVDHLDIRPRQASSDRDAVTAVVAGRRGEPSRSERVTRESNRLIAIDLQQPNSARDSVAPVWTIGGTVGAVNWFYRMDENDDGRVTVDEFKGKSNEFAEIDKDKDGTIRPTEADAFANRGRPQNALTGHFFLGPPRPVDGRLFAMTECDRQLNLVALESATGKLLWSQGIGFVDHPVEEDPFRYTLSCSPIVASGVVICPTQIGVLAAVDASDGALLWAYYYGDDNNDGPFGNWSYAVRRSFGHQGFPCEPEVFGDRIVYLPRQSDEIHCLELTSGRLLWKAPRNGAEYVAAMHEGVVMIVGQRYCRGMSLVNGTETWSSRLGMPAGRGVQVGRQFLVPLQEGRIATLDIASGRESGLSVPRVHTAAKVVPSETDEDDTAPSAATATSTQPSDWRPGNLVVAGDSILSVDSRRMVALPQAEPLLIRVQTALSTQSPQGDAQLLAGELESTLGRIAAAKAHLGEALARNLPAQQRQRAEALMREMLYHELQQNGDNETALLAELEQYLRSPEDRGRYLMFKVDAQLRRHDFDGVLASTRECAALHHAGMLPSAGDPTHFVSVPAWTSDAIGRFQEVLDDEMLESVHLRIDEAQQAALKDASVEALERFLELYARWPQADKVRTALAKRLMDRGEYQRAELLLIENRRGADPSASRSASLALVQLWDRVGLPEEAATLWLESQATSDIRSALASLKSALPAGSLTPSAVERALGPQSRVTRVRITQSSGMLLDTSLADAFGTAGRQFPCPTNSSFQLVDKGNSGFGDISIIDRLTGLVVGNVEVTAPYTGSTLCAVSQVGHWVPLGSGTTMHGLSLLERARTKPAWSVVPPRLGTEVDSMMVGPTGPTFCVFQAHRHLVVADPATGRILWQRTDLDPHSGLDADVCRGIIGDEEVLVVFGFDRATYTAYVTRTGEELRRGKLEVNNGRQSQERRVFGRMLFHFAETGTENRPERRMRLWDPLSDRFLIDVPVSESTVWRDTPDGEIVALLPPNRLVVLDGRTGAVRLDRELEPERLEKLTKEGGSYQVAAMRDHERYYVNIQPSQMPVEEIRYNYQMGDTVLPRFDIRGELLAFDRESGKLLWSRTMPQRSLLRIQHVRLPFLIGMSLSGDKGGTNRQTLTIEAIDSATGETIGLEERAKRFRVLQFTYDHLASQISLRGEHSVVHLEFGKEVKPFEALTEQ